MYYFFSREFYSYLKRGRIFTEKLYPNTLKNKQSLNTTNIIPVLLLYRNHSTDFYCKSMGWCLFDCNTGWKWFNPNLGGLLGVRFEVGGGGGENYLLKACWNYSRNFKFGT